MELDQKSSLFDSLTRSRWVKMPYDIIRKEDVENKKREFTVNTLKPEDLLLPYDKYISTPLKSVEPVVFEPFKNLFQKPEYQPPYLELVKLNTESEKDIINYVNKYGLLGILNHNYRFLDIKDDSGNYSHNHEDDIYSKWYKFDYDDESIYPLTDEKIEAMRGKVFKHIKGQTDLVIRKFLSSKYESDSYIKTTKKLLNDTFNPASDNPYNREPYTLLKQDIYFREILGSGYDRNADYDTGEDAILEYSFHSVLCNLYAEPLELFIAEANKFQRLFFNKATIEKIEDRKEREYLLHDLYLDLYRNIKAVHPKPGFNILSQDITAEWEVPSILSAYYLLFYLDIARGYNMQVCHNKECSKPFIANLKKPIYCSTRCSNLVRKHRQLENESEIFKRVQKAGNQYRPKKVKLLFVTEFDRNIESNDSFYLVNPEGEEDVLFVETIKTLYPDEYSDPKTILADKLVLLNRLKNDGVYMIDGSKTKRQKKVVYATIRRNVREVAHKSDTSIVVISTNHGKDIIDDLRKHGFKVINKETINFPYAAENRKTFRDKVSELLKQYSKS